MEELVSQSFDRKKMAGAFTGERGDWGGHGGKGEFLENDWYLRPLVADVAVVAKCHLSALYRHEKGKLFAQLVDLLQFYERFEINDYLAPSCSQTPVIYSERRVRRKSLSPGRMPRAIAEYVSCANILLPRPGFPIYELCAAFRSLEVRHFDLLPEKGFEADLVAIAALADQNSKKFEAASTYFVLPISFVYLPKSIYFEAFLGVKSSCVVVTFSDAKGVAASYLQN
ncbi:hypothetical protein DKX38_024426 [Salix brachista]|uniref:RNA helicase aquarius N-terminal domain-containing protein n=1 Tax=Salix brachista TaxID=2182728 RepID=A0A5N5JZ42_9ROSI|nr:hypothetical protein DKX38_024426 [Salix brachista]